MIDVWRTLPRQGSIRTRGSSYPRREIIALTGCLGLSGCTSVPGLDTSEKLPILVGLEVHNDTDQTQEYRIRVQYTADPDMTPETTFSDEGTVPAREEIDIEDAWAKEPGRYVVGLSVDGGDWHTQDITDRLTQRERICFAQEVAIEDGGETALFMTNLDAQCPAR